VRLRLLVLRLRVAALGIVRIGLRDQERELRAVGRPRDRRRTGLVVGDLLSIAAAEIEQVDLRLLAVAP